MKILGIKTLGHKILIVFAIFLLVTATILLLAIVNLRTLGRASNSILTENYRSILAADSMLGSIERQDSGILLVVLGFQDEGISQFISHESQFLQWLGRAKDNITIVGEDKILSQIESEYSKYIRLFSEFKLESMQKGEAGTFYHEQILPCFNTIRDELVRLREINQRTMEPASSRASTAWRQRSNPSMT